MGRWLLYSTYPVSFIQHLWSSRHIDALRGHGSVGSVHKRRIAAQKRLGTKLFLFLVLGFFLNVLESKKKKNRMKMGYPGQEAALR